MDEATVTLLDNLGFALPSFGVYLPFKDNLDVSSLDLRLEIRLDIPFFPYFTTAKVRVLWCVTFMTMPKNKFFTVTCDV